MRADRSTEDNGYTGPLSHYHVEVCPNLPAGREYILHKLEEEFQRFSDIELDFLSLWPYDQGGCTCAKCKPWGANGFVMMAEAIAVLFRALLPARRSQPLHLAL